MPALGWRPSQVARTAPVAPLHVRHLITAANVNLVEPAGYAKMDAVQDLLALAIITAVLRVQADIVSKHFKTKLFYKRASRFSVKTDCNF
ncbi:hypothetical protein COOONC_04130 [Cooperia oncophora]